MQQEPVLTPLQAASVLQDTRLARETLNNRAAAMAWIAWALVITSLAGTLGFLDRIPHEDLSGRDWGLFLAANLLAIVIWAGVGGLIQTAIHRTFSLERPTGHSNWKGAAIAFGVAFLVVVATFGLGNGRIFWGVGPDATMEQQHHNLGFAIPLQIGAALLAAVTVLQGYRGYSRRPGLIATGACIVASFVAVAPWFPSLGTSGAFLAAAAMPLIFLAIGLAYWRQG
jgi:hypothetical protein